ncbi:cysteine hydrolase family protein [Anabaena sp. FACHB-1237]|uniref:cysteine hydrolase family protein n=1 Tax=Anabaena sp. FACHB-1237 TaxID=2692769 RepID=UPI0016815236|nr:cysteine hydrolase family protein [Anabaena sp. FACHB-1237]MBD2138364.1 cysteine hydrolase family protein [Anabaena sp. FACHB-1237]
MNLPLRNLGVSPNNWSVNENFADITRPQKTPQAIILATETKALRIDLAKTAIMVIDMQNDFCHPDGWLAHIGVDVTPARQPIEPLQQLLPQLRVVNVPIIWLNWGNREDLLNISAGLHHVYNPTGQGIGLGDRLPKNGAKVLTFDSWAAAVVDELQQLPEDIYIHKYRMSGFWDTALDSILRNLGITTILFTGVNADQCVFTTLCDANFLGYDCILIKDCTATTSPEYCWLATLYNVKQCFGFVTDSSAIYQGLNP